jgi:3-oxoadipate enol-lactonase
MTGFAPTDKTQRKLPDACQQAPRDDRPLAASSPPPSARFASASINGIEIRYAVAGAGPVLVLVHGLACGRRMWGRQVRAFSSRFTVVTYDQRGHGLTSAPDETDAYSPGHLSRDLAGLLDHLGIAACHVVGFSMGGGPALALAAAQPQRVRSLVLADVGAGAENPAATQALVRRWLGVARAGGMAALAEEMLRSEFYKTYARRSARARRHMRALIMATPPRGLENTLTEVLAKRSSLFRSTQTLAAISAPTLVLTGADDYVCRKAAQLMARTIPGAREVRIPAAGHMSPLEVPAAFNDAVLEFLARQDPPPRGSASPELRT